MEEEAPPHRSVAELAGKFRDIAPAQEDATGKHTEKPVRRRPPRSLQLPKTHGDEDQSPGVTSPAKSKRNSALIEKLQASLALSPSAQLPSPKSPGFRLLPPSYPPPSPGSAPVTTATTGTTPTTPVPASPITEEEGPTSFEASPTVVEGSILSSINKSRARHSIRRRPPSRRHKMSSSGEEVSVADDVTNRGEGGDQEDVFKTETKTDDSTFPENKQIHKDDESKTETKEEEEEKVGGDRSSSGQEKEEEEEKKSSGEETTIM